MCYLSSPPAERTHIMHHCIMYQTTHEKTTYFMHVPTPHINMHLRLIHDATSIDKYGTFQLCLYIGRDVPSIHHCIHIFEEKEVISIPCGLLINPLSLIDLVIIPLDSSYPPKQQWHRLRKLEYSI